MYDNPIVNIIQTGVAGALFGGLAYALKKLINFIVGSSKESELINGVNPKINDDEIFPNGTRFFDVQSVPVTMQLNKLGLPVANAWDIIPPRELDCSYVKSHGIEIDREKFDEIFESLWEKSA